MFVLCSTCMSSINRDPKNINGCAASWRLGPSLGLQGDTRTKIYMETLKSTLHHIYFIVILLRLQLIKNNLLNMIKKRAYARLDAPHAVSWFEPNRMFSSPGVRHARDQSSAPVGFHWCVLVWWDEVEGKATAGGTSWVPPFFFLIKL